MHHAAVKTNNAAAKTMSRAKRVTRKISSHGDPGQASVLVTGGTGFVATWVINHFLANGYRVRTTVRSAAKGNDVKETHIKYDRELEFVIVEDITKDGAFDDAVKGVDGVVHTASPFILQVEDNERDLLRPAIKGTEGILKSITKTAPHVERVVITSSFAAIIDPAQGARPGYTYSEKDWCPVSHDDTKTGDRTLAYLASKTSAEKAAHDFVKQEHPNFTIAAICPPMIYGPLAQKATIDHLNTSAADIWRFLDGSLAKEDVPDTAFPAFVDVRNVAQTHLQAYEHDTKENERSFITAGTFTNADVAAILHKKFSNRELKIPDPQSAKPFEHFEVDNAKSRRELGIEYISLEQCMENTARSLFQVAETSEKGVAYDGQEWFGHV